MGEKVNYEYITLAILMQALMLTLDEVRNDKKFKHKLKYHGNKTLEEVEKFLDNMFEIPVSKEKLNDASDTLGLFTLETLEFIKKNIKENIKEN